MDSIIHTNLNSSSKNTQQMSIHQKHQRSGYNLNSNGRQMANGKHDFSMLSESEQFEMRFRDRNHDDKMNLQMGRGRLLCKAQFTFVP